MPNLNDMDGFAGDETKSFPRGHWRPAEDEKLRRLVQQHGAQNWNFIAEKLQGRSGMSLFVITFDNFLFFFLSFFFSPLY